MRAFYPLPWALIFLVTGLVPAKWSVKPLSLFLIPFVNVINERQRAGKSCFSNDSIF